MVSSPVTAAHEYVKSASNVGEHSLQISVGILGCADIDGSPKGHKQWKSCLTDDPIHSGHEFLSFFRREISEMSLAIPYVSSVEW